VVLAWGKDAKWTDAPRKHRGLKENHWTKHKLTPELQANMQKWTKGMPSPNPGGRPKTKPMTDELKRILNRNVKGKKYTYLQLIVARAVKRALAGNDVMTKEVWNRMDGILHVEPKADDISQVGVRVIIDDAPRPDPPPDKKTIEVQAQVSKGNG
jgi:Family of unknown function (DUF5681)